MKEEKDILPIGTLVHDRYLVVQVLGRGGFGTVYQVRDQQTENELFALKEVIDSRKKERARLIHEWELLKQLHHSSLPRVYQVFDDSISKRTYMLMEYVEGTDLEVLWQQQPKGYLPLPYVMSIMAPIIEAVAYLHSHHPPIVHRDIKPANIVVPKAGEKAVLVDFGIAKEHDPDATTTAQRHCSQGYAAPEQYLAGTNTRTDIYALGATLYTLLTGVLPADAFYRLMQLDRKGIDPLVFVSQLAPDIPMPVAKALHRALSIQSSDRFESVDAFWQAVNAPLSVHHSLVHRRSTSVYSRLHVRVRQAVATVPAVSRYKQLSASRSRRLGFLLFTVLTLLLCFSFVLGGVQSYDVKQQESSSYFHVPTYHQTMTPTRSIVKPTVSAPSPTPRPTMVSPISPSRTSLHKKNDKQKKNGDSGHDNG